MPPYLGQQCAASNLVGAGIRKLVIVQSWEKNIVHPNPFTQTQGIAFYAASRCATVRQWLAHIAERFAWTRLAGKTPSERPHSE